MSNTLNPDQDRHLVGPDLGQSVWGRYQQMAKVEASKERVKKVYLDLLLSCDFITLTAGNTSKDKSIILIKWSFF